MKKGDFIWVGSLIAIILLLVVPSTHKVFISATASHPYFVGFLKFAILATMGELLAGRIVGGNYKKHNGLIAKACVWGFLGIVITLIFNIYAAGVIAAQGKGLLLSGAPILFAFFTSAIMNLSFAPTMMAFHRFTDTFIDMKYEGKNPNISSVAKTIDWDSFVSFVIVKTIPLFWIPAHTITFLLPAEYRVLAAAFLSIALGAILAFAKRK
ncbi:hypothetical protein [Helicovermis profundi]|uniref:Mpv17 / PMP22 family protein n=1 Tax=Helicovermis profundi TaxID=3065157 RepID=A0AAU9EYA6_9FIRM|nr:hypothetical protein HLPR_23810 [Clostridia bacterium S502]